MVGSYCTMFRPSTFDHRFIRSVNRAVHSINSRFRLSKVTLNVWQFRDVFVELCGPLRFLPVLASSAIIKYR
jgi:hypothetical protein